MSVMLRRLIVLFVVVCGSHTVPAANASESAVLPPWCVRQPSGVFDVSALPVGSAVVGCDLRGELVGRDGIALAVPPLGESSAAAALGTPEFPGGAEFIVSHDLDGIFVREGPGLEIPQAPTGGPAECADSHYGAGVAYKMKLNLNYGFRVSTTPTYEVQSTVESAVRGGLSGLLSHANNCSESRDPAALNLNYTGRTATASNITANGCGVLDASHVVDFGPLPTNFLALTCSRFNSSTGSLLNFDIRMSVSNGYKWDATQANGCNGGYDIVGTMTHEFGHVYGISHVSEATHGFQTMSTSINGAGCQQAERTLAKGDMLHMIAKYGVK